MKNEIKNPQIKISSVEVISFFDDINNKMSTLSLTEDFKRNINKELCCTFWKVISSERYYKFDKDTDVIDIGLMKKVFFQGILLNINLTEDFIEKFIDDINWDSLSYSYSFSEEFIERNQDRINWIAYSSQNAPPNQKYFSEDFIEKYKHKLNLNSVLRTHTYLSPKIKQKIEKWLEPEYQSFEKSFNKQEEFFKNFLTKLYSIHSISANVDKFNDLITLIDNDGNFSTVYKNYIDNVYYTLNKIYSDEDLMDKILEYTLLNHYILKTKQQS